ncbi:MAG: hypothetical protein ACTH1D_08600 [Mycobacteriaceae bacterium]|uniref:hypothetical protein n=1 Tax=Corynebacterium sp. TaxID=1720 RepID=UPI003F9C5752
MQPPLTEASSTLLILWLFLSPILVIAAWILHLSGIGGRVTESLLVLVGAAPIFVDAVVQLGDPENWEPLTLSLNTAIVVVVIAVAGVSLRVFATPGRTLTYQSDRRSDGPR